MQVGSCPNEYNESDRGQMQFGRVGSGGLVMSSLPSGVVAMGFPARIVRRIDIESIEALQIHCQNKNISKRVSDVALIPCQRK